MAATELALIAPLTGAIVPLEQVPDPVFAGRMLGDGIAIEPLSASLLAPCDGVITQLHRAGHALTLTADNGAEILLHIGIDTVHLNGGGFSPQVNEGARVRAGELLISFDADRIAGKVPCLQTMILVANGDRYPIAWRAADRVEAGTSRLFTLTAAGGVSAAPTVGAPGSDGPERSLEAIVAHAGGLHARPAALVQASARRFDAEVTVTFGQSRASARSMVALMRLGTTDNSRVQLSARGHDAEPALAAVRAALETPSAAEAPPALSLVAAPSDGPGLTGVCAAPGLAIGRVVRLDAVTVEPPAPLADQGAEHARLDAALKSVRDELAAALREADARQAIAERDILSAHEALLDDPEIVAVARRLIDTGRSAGIAFRHAVHAQCEALATLASPLIAERIADLRDLERRVISAMSGRAAALPELFESSILVADDLALSDFTRLPRERIVGLCTARGGATSHIAILARAAGVPALVAVGPSLFSVAHGREVLLDASAGRLDPAPDDARLGEARAQLVRLSLHHARALADARTPATTRDGHTVEVAANIATPDDAREAVSSGADGVGLLRTELLFLDRAEAPSVDEQRRAYQAVLDALDGRPAIIRTLDVGGDKSLPFLPLPPEPNPALGLRGIRLSLARPDVLETQLRGLLGVRPLARLRIMLPMVTDASEVRTVRARLDALARELGLVERPQLGVMVEVPSAAVLADQLARHADFLSIGTNDLTQYALAMDRCHPGLAARVDGLHPTVLRLIMLAVQGAAAAGKWVGVCGALASDPLAVPVLVGLGVSELSVSPRLVPEVKARIRELDHAACQREARALIELESPSEIRTRARALWPLS